MRRRTPAREVVAVVQEEDAAVHVDGGADAQVRHAVARCAAVKVAWRAAHALRVLQRGTEENVTMVRSLERSVHNLVAQLCSGKCW